MKISFEWTYSAIVFIPRSFANATIVRNLIASVTKITGVTPLLNTKGGTSDARHFAEFGVDAIEFGVINDRIHAKNERVSINEVNKLYEIFKDLIENFH